MLIQEPDDNERKKLQITLFVADGFSVPDQVRIWSI